MLIGDRSADKTSGIGRARDLKQSVPRKRGGIISCMLGVTPTYIFFIPMPSPLYSRPAPLRPLHYSRGHYRRCIRQVDLENAPPHRATGGLNRGRRHVYIQDFFYVYISFIYNTYEMI